MISENIDKIKSGCSVVLVCTSSESMNYFIYSKVLKEIDCTRDTCRTLRNTKDMNKAGIDAISEPFNCSRWLFTVDISFKDKKRASLTKSIKKNLKTNEAGVYYIKVDKYFIYKELVKEFCKEEMVCFYADKLDSKDMLFVYDSIVPEKLRMKKELYSYFCEEYSTDVDAVFKLFEHIRDGESVQNKKDIAEICGYGKNTVPRFTFGLVASKMSSDLARSEKDLTDEKVRENVSRGRKTIIKNKVKLANDMREVYEWRNIHASVLNLVKAMCDLKMLYINGSLYKKSLDMDAVEGYDEKLLKQGMKYWYKVTEIPMSQWINLRVKLEKNIWYSDMDFIKFLYEYYK